MKQTYITCDLATCFLLSSQELSVVFIGIKGIEYKKQELVEEKQCSAHIPVPGCLVLAGVQFEPPQFSQGSAWRGGFIPKEGSFCPPGSSSWLLNTIGAWTF